MAIWKIKKKEKKTVFTSYCYKKESFLLKVKTQPGYYWLVASVCF